MVQSEPARREVRQPSAAVISPLTAWATARQPRQRPGALCLSAAAAAPGHRLEPDQPSWAWRSQRAAMMIQRFFRAARFRRRLRLVLLFKRRSSSSLLSPHRGASQAISPGTPRSLTRSQSRPQLQGPTTQAGRHVLLQPSPRASRRTEELQPDPSPRSTGKWPSTAGDAAQAHGLADSTRALTSPPGSPGLALTSPPGSPRASDAPPHAAGPSVRSDRAHDASDRAHEESREALHDALAAAAGSARQATGGRTTAKASAHRLSPPSSGHFPCFHAAALRRRPSRVS